MPSELVDLDLAIEGATENAVRVRNLKGESVWLPRSQVEIDGEGEPSRKPVTVTMPRWVAEEKELV